MSAEEGAGGAGFLSRWSRRKAQARVGPALPAPAERREAAGRAPDHAPPSASPSASDGAGSVPRGGLTAGPASAPAEGNLSRPLDAASASAGAAASASAAASTSAATAPSGARIEAAPLPTLDDVAALTPESDFSAYVGREVDASVRNAAMKKLFADPHFNVMDGLDIYIDDYNQTTPIPPSVLRKMVQSKFLGLFDDEEEDALEARTPPETTPVSEPAAVPAADPQVCDEDPDLQLQPDDAAGRSGPDESPGSVKV